MTTPLQRCRRACTNTGTAAFSCRCSGLRSDHCGRIPVYILFAAVMVPVGMLAGAAARLDVPAKRTVVFSGATRNSLVVLPLVLALPATFDLAPLVVVTQTLIELVIMVIFVRLIPRLLPEKTPRLTAA